MKVSELVEAARDELAMGWTQGALSNSEGVCAVGALRRATMNHVQDGAVAVFKQANLALDAKAAEMYADVGMRLAPESVMSFNDYDQTSKQDVLNLMDKTVLGLQEAGI